MEQSENFDFSWFISRLYVEAAFKKPSKLMSYSSWVLLQTVMSSKYEKVSRQFVIGDNRIHKTLKCRNPVFDTHKFSFELI